jgi:site-specific DNA-cytosine methylase
MTLQKQISLFTAEQLTYLPAVFHANHLANQANESIKAMGNAVVPQLVLQIFKSIEQYEIQNI